MEQLSEVVVSVAIDASPEIVRTWVLAAAAVLHHELADERRADGLVLKADYGLGDTDSILLDVSMVPSGNATALSVAARWRPWRIAMGDRPLQDRADRLVATVSGFALASKNGLEVPGSGPPPPPAG